ncbi:Bug family tripartite tricarboxylate transporter substrate binding protein [Pseudorhodoplanes sp.]|uniref:Bug family tripartite tricarboxylate transporter substrate binding protein n=1 Tax=Pseudorhodoplanes sp. TaxID=1934341 RepID=UPI00391AD20F
MLPRILIFWLSAILTTTTVQAQSWPERPVRIVVSQAAGSTPDIICRILADKLSAAFGQQFFVENRPGGANIVGAQAAAKSPPDGYTFFFATAAALASNPHTFKTLPYDPLRDFAPVSMIAKGPFFILANPALKASSLKEVIARDKADPGKMAIATEGSRNFTGILAGWLNRKAGTKLVEVPYTTITNGVQDAITGRVQLISLPITSAAPFIASGELTPLAVSSLKPMPKFESIPPIAETLPGVELVGWFVLVAPAGTPEAIAQRVNQEMNKILNDPAMRERLVELGFFSDGGETVAATGKFIKEQYEIWKEVVRDIGLEPQ